ncbi:MAG: hypothetical protein QM831_03000 [Kofleriaceae bacterium]
MMFQLAGLAIDARYAIHETTHVGRAHAARWIAANALACRGAKLAIESILPSRASLYSLRTRSLYGAIAAIAAVPALIDAATLPRHWRMALRALGMPFLTGTPREAIEDGASVVGCEVVAPCELAASEYGDEFRVRISQRMLAA